MDWIHDNLRIGALQWALGDETFQAPEVLHKNGFNVEQLCHVIQGDSLTTVFSPEENAEDLARYMELCKKYGTRVILYFNAHCVPTTIIDKHPEYAQRFADGKAVPAYGSLSMTCVNSPWRSVFMESVSQALEYGIDGVFLDGPIFSGAGCCCESCKKMFKEKYNTDITQGTFRQLTEFHTDSIASFVADAKKTIMGIRPEVVVYANSTGLAQNVTGCDLDAVFPHVDLIGTEGGFMFYYDPNDTSLWKGASNANYLESKSFGKPYVIFDAGNHCSWARSMHTRSETRLMFASAVANGAQVWYGLHGPLDTLDTVGGKAACEMNLFLQKNAKHYSKTKRVKKLALLWAKQTMDAFPEEVEQTDFTTQVKRQQNEDRGNFFPEFKGFYDLLVRNHIQVAVIDEKNIRNGELSDFTHLVVPNAFCMAEDVAGHIKDFVKGGGNLLSTMATSFYDVDGEPYDKPLLADVIGLAKVKGAHTHGLGCSYMRMPEEGRAATGLKERIAGCQKILRCEFSPSVQVLADSYEPMDGAYAPVTTDSFPLLVQNKYGNGTSTYIAANLGETYIEYGVDDLKILATWICGMNLDSDLRLEGAYESMMAELRSQPSTNSMLLHLVNYTGHMRRPITQVIPCKGVKAAVRTGADVRRVFTLVSEQELAFDMKDGFVNFTVPDIDEYEVVIIEM